MRCQRGGVLNRFQESRFWLEKITDLHFVQGRPNHIDTRTKNVLICMGYGPSVRPRWRDIGHVLFLRVYEPRRSRGP